MHRRETSVLTPCFRRAWPLRGRAGFSELLHAIDEADRDRAPVAAQASRRGSGRPFVSLAIVRDRREGWWASAASAFRL